jgi:hypothetical protein
LGSFGTAKTDPVSVVTRYVIMPLAARACRQFGTNLFPSLGGVVVNQLAGGGQGSEAIVQ